MSSSSDFKVKKGLQIQGGDINLSNAQHALIQVDGSGATNTAGKNLTISAGEGDGTAAGGDVIFQTAPAPGSGNGAGVLSTALTLADDNAAAFTGAVTVASLSATGATTLNGAVTLGDASGDDITNVGSWVGDFVPKVDSAIDLGTSSLQFATAHIDTGHIDALTVTGTSTLSTVDIGAGAVDGTAIGANSASTGAFTTFSATGTSTLTTVDINAGTIDGATIATSDVTVGSGKTLDVSAGTLTLAANQISGNAVEGGTIAAITITDLTLGGALSLGDNALTNVGDIDADSISVDTAATGLNVDFSAANTGTGVITLRDAMADALSITDGSADWMVFNTNAETLTIGKAINTKSITINDPSLTLGTGAAADSFVRFHGNAQDWFVGVDDSTDLLKIGGGYDPSIADDTTIGITVDHSGNVKRLGQSTHTNGLYLKLDSGNAVWSSVSSASIDEYTNAGTANRVLTSIDASGANAEANLTFDGTDALIGGAGKLQFRDTGLFINSSTNGQMDIDADASIDITTPAVSITSTTRVAMTTPEVQIVSATAAKPVLTISNTHAAGAAGELKFNKDTVSGDDEDIMGTISWYGTDSGENTEQKLAYINAVITDAAAGSETAKLDFYVAENDGTNTLGLSIRGQADDNGEVDVLIGAGVGSTTTVVGNLTVSGATTTVSSTTLEVTDDIITVSKGNDTIANANGSGVEIDATLATNLYWKYVHANTAWTSNVDIDTATTSDVYKIAGTEVLGAAALGAGVLSSGLTTVGPLASGSIASGFGTISTGNAITTTGTVTGATLDGGNVTISTNTIASTNTNGNVIVDTHGTGTLDVYSGIEVGGQTASHLNADADGTLLITAHTDWSSSSSIGAIFTYNSDIYRSAKFLIQLSNDTNAEFIDLMVTHRDASPDNTNDFFLSMGSVVDTGTQLADDFTITHDGSTTATLNLDPTGTFAGTVKVFATLIAED